MRRHVGRGRPRRRSGPHGAAMTRPAPSEADECPYPAPEISRTTGPGALFEATQWVVGVRYSEIPHTVVLLVSADGVEFQELAAGHRLSSWPTIETRPSRQLQPLKEPLPATESFCSANGPRDQRTRLYSLWRWALKA